MDNSDEEYYSQDENNSENHQNTINVITEHCQLLLKNCYDNHLTNNTLDLYPEYQRDFCWNTKTQDNLIDTIMKTYIIPLFTFYDNKDDNNKTRLECIDGQHRLRVIKAYIESEPIDDHIILWRTFDKDGNKSNVLYEENNLTKSYKIQHKRYMTKEEKDIFDNYKLFICKITNKLPIRQIYDMFDRMQQGHAINSIDKFKNINNSIIIGLNKHLLFRYDKIKQINGNILFNYDIKNRNRITIKSKFINIIICSIILLEQNAFNIIFHNEQSLHKLILNNVIVIKDEYINNHIEFILDFIALLYTQIHKTNNFPDLQKGLCKYIFYILLFIHKQKLLVKHEDISKLLNIINKEDYNNIELYEGEKRNKIPTETDIISIYTKLSKSLHKKINTKSKINKKILSE